jgi:hypothetical protein
MLIYDQELFRQDPGSSEQLSAKFSKLSVKGNDRQGQSCKGNGIGIMEPQGALHEYDFKLFKLILLQRGFSRFVIGGREGI